jgi:hypothetical protein
MGWLKDSNTHTHKVGMGPTTSFLSPTPHKTIRTQGWKQCMTPPTPHPPKGNFKETYEIAKTSPHQLFEGNMRIYSHD